MKIMIATLSVFFLLTASTQAQVTPKAFVIGGTGDFSFSIDPNQNTESRRLYAGIAPQIGRFVNEKWLIDGSVGYGFSKFSSELNENDFAENRGHSVLGSAGATRFIQLLDGLYLTAGATIRSGYSIATTESYFGDSFVETQNESVFGGVALSAGLAYFLNPQWMIYSSIGVFNYDLSYDLESSEISHDFYSRLRGNNFGIGVRYLILPKN